MNDERATKAVLGIYLREGEESTLYRYFGEDKDIGFGLGVRQSVLAQIKKFEVRSLIMMEAVFGCPHEEAIDYPEGEACPQCPFWKGQGRYAGIE